jgi:hypothetical protein
MAESAGRFSSRLPGEVHARGRFSALAGVASHVTHIRRTPQRIMPMAKDRYADK